MLRRPRGARRLSVRRADRPHCSQPASPQAPFRRGARAYPGAIRRLPAGPPRRRRAATIDAYRAAEAPADLERRLDDGVAREARRDRFEICDLRGGLWRAVPFLLVGQVGAQGPRFYADKTVLHTWVLPGEEAIFRTAPSTLNGGGNLVDYLRDHPVYDEGRKREKQTS
jgi:hypothetical protein